jgi:serine/threonine-protein kinase
MLQADAGAGRRLESSVENAAARLADNTSIRGLLNQRSSEGPEELAPGSRLGVYRLVSELGRGGMSIVYLATRSDDEFEQTVAVKVLRQGPVNPDLSNRLLAERQILARLSHPNIARLLDGGTTDEGMPFFVMEVIEGEPIDQHCDRLCLDLSARIRIFQKVCQAVQFAHRNLVVHRDIKPSNVLVIEGDHGKGGEPKLLDFGIAKLLDPASPLDTTKSMFQMGTPGYSSPEQIQNLPITTASDVYSLGVLLYRLLTGGRPYALGDSAPIRDLEVAILDQQPRLPSVVARQMGNEKARMRGDRVEVLSRRLEGDLDNIIVMALRKEPERRYGSVENFSADLERYLVGLPVRARPNTFSYRARKFLRRHRLGIVTAGFLVAMAVAFIATLLRQEARVIRQRDRAEQISTMLVSLFEAAGPSSERQPDLTARDLLDLGQEELGRLEDQPETQAMLRHTLGTLYQELGFFDQAQSLFARAVEQRKELYGESHPAVVESLYHLGLACALAGDHARAEPHFRQALELRRTLLGEDHPEVALSLNSLALVLHEQGDYRGAEPIYRQALAKSERVNGALHPQTMKTRGNLALLLLDLGHYHEAETIFRRALENWQTIEGQSQMVAEVFDGLAQSLAAQGDTVAAEAIAREVLETRRSHLGNDHVHVARSLAHLADIVRQRDPSAAEVLAQEALDQRRSWLGDDNAETGESFAILASIQALQGNRDDAEALYRRAIDSYAIGLSPSHPMAARPVAELGILLAEAGDCGLALTLLENAIEHLPAADRRTKPVREALQQCTDL